jgi:RNA polymerase sigma-70 factor (sigma-E family)
MKVEAEDQANRDERFVLFVQTHTDALLRSAYLLTRDAPDAEELVQDTLAWLYPRWAQVELAEHRLAYVRKSLVNRFLAGRRRLSSSEVRFDDALELVRDEGYPDATTHVDQRLEIWRALGELSERQRAAVVLRFFHDLADADVAEVLDCRVGTVRSLISRSLTALRLAGAFDEEGGSTYLRTVT